MNRKVHNAARDMITAIMDIYVLETLTDLSLMLRSHLARKLGTRQQLAKLNQADMTIHLPDGALTHSLLRLTS